ncbi:hypothetical protein FJTKL_11178 [Diaporthe vaccinii]|uniref:Uncharacterized protein n=1 Tax=Diaporthe vaccinii TaxID=105482 RepID=A0ABR4EIA4_9PEZI
MVRTPESKEDAEQFARQLLRLQKWCSENNRMDIEIDPEHLKICQKIWPHEPKVLNKDEDDIPKNWKNTAGAKNAGNQISIYWETAKKAQKTDDEEAEKAAKEAEKAAEEAEEAADKAEKAAKDMDDIANDMKNDEYIKKAKDMKKSAEDAKKAAEKAKEAAEKAKKAAEDAKKAKDAKNAKGAQAAAQDAKIAAGDVQKASSQAKHLADLAAKEVKEAKKAKKAKKAQEAKASEAKEAAKLSIPKVKTDPDPQQAIPDTKVKLEYPDLLDDALDLFSNLTLDNNNNLEVEDFGSKGEPDEIYFFRDPFTGLDGTVKGNILFTPMNGKCFGFALPTDDGKFKFGFAPVTGQYEKKYLQFQTAYGNYERSRVIIMSKDRELRTLGFDDLAQLQYIGTGYMLPPSGIPSDRITEEDGVPVWTYDGDTCPPTWSIFQHKRTGRLGMVSKSLSCITYKDHFKDKMITYLQDTKIPIPRRRVKKQFAYL